jgi:hypothetical protein
MRVVPPKRAAAVASRVGLGSSAPARPTRPPLREGCRPPPPRALLQDLTGARGRSRAVWGPARLRSWRGFHRCSARRGRLSVAIEKRGTPTRLPLERPDVLPFFFSALFDRRVFCRARGHPLPKWAPRAALRRRAARRRNRAPLMHALGGATDAHETVPAIFRASGPPGQLPALRDSRQRQHDDCGVSVAGTLGVKCGESIAKGARTSPMKKHCDPPGRYIQGHRRKT